MIDFNNTLLVGSLATPLKSDDISDLVSAIIGVERNQLCAVVDIYKKNPLELQRHILGHAFGVALAAPGPRHCTLRKCNLVKICSQFR